MKFCFIAVLSIFLALNTQAQAPICFIRYDSVQKQLSTYKRYQIYLDQIQQNDIDSIACYLNKRDKIMLGVPHRIKLSDEKIKSFEDSLNFYDLRIKEVEKNENHKIQLLTQEYSKKAIDEFHFYAKLFCREYGIHYILDVATTEFLNDKLDFTSYFLDFIHQKNDKTLNKIVDLELVKIIDKDSILHSLPAYNEVQIESKRVIELYEDTLRVLDEQLSIQEFLWNGFNPKTEKSPQEIKKLENELNTKLMQIQDYRQKMELDIVDLNKQWNLQIQNEYNYYLNQFCKENNIDVLFRKNCPILLSEKLDITAELLQFIGNKKIHGK